MALNPKIITLSGTDGHITMATVEIHLQTKAVLSFMDVIFLT